MRTEPRVPCIKLLPLPYLQEDEQSGSVSELGVTNVGGIFLVLALGMVVGGAVAAVEYCVGGCKKSITY